MTLIRYATPKPLELIETMQLSLKVYPVQELATKLLDRITLATEPPHYIQMTPRTDRPRVNARMPAKAKKKALYPYPV
jgi:hypothetical protein